MAAPYPIPAGRHQVEIAIQRSRFVATADRAETVEAAKALLGEMRRVLPDATHHVHAFAVGFGASVVQGCSDDGEPAGTAGRPTLAVVGGSGLGDVCVVTTRYFGGTKLGTGGLVRAYTEAAQAVLAGLPRVMKVEKATIRLALPYRYFEPCQRLIEANGGEITEKDFGVEVTLAVLLAADRVEAFGAEVAELTGGLARIAVGSGAGLRAGPPAAS
jgi:uncharacterized YigZ family protein